MKGLRSKSKRHFRTVRRALIVETPRHIELEQEKVAKLEQAVNAPKPDNGPSLQDEQADTAMAVDSDLPELTTKNPAKLAKKLRARRLAAAKGITKAAKKKSNPLAGANQFHRKKKKKGRR